MMKRFNLVVDMTIEAKSMLVMEDVRIYSHLVELCYP